MALKSVTQVDVWGVYGRDAVRYKGVGHDYRVEVLSPELPGGRVLVDIMLDIDAASTSLGRQELLALEAAVAITPELQEFGFPTLARILKEYRDDPE